MRSSRGCREVKQPIPFSEFVIVLHQMVEYFPNVSAQPYLTGCHVYCDR